MQRVFVGDVQGCAEELLELLDRLRGRFGDDFELWVVGDLVNRGPDNRRPLEWVRERVEAGRAHYVLGNHEIHLLCVALGLRDLAPGDSIGDVLAAPDAQDWIDWLRRRPVVAAGGIGDQRFAMVHAAASPEWSLEELVRQGDAVAARLAGSCEAARGFLAMDAEADPVRDALARITRCRSIGVDGRWSSREPEGGARPWHRVWAEHGHDYGLVYGHWARQGLHVARGLRGLDSGCVHHGRGRDGFLTAWLPGETRDEPGMRPFDVPDDRFWQLAARRRYYRAASDPPDATGIAG
ncbi:MAG: metallophosphoesterase [Spirochaetaceae bacterium]|nr:metallophosphoesterase [Spirochaetaceae bacterium]HPG28306.1 metallophosphoesterase [Myxococcota bacterium]